MNQCDGSGVVSSSTELKAPGHSPKQRGGYLVSALSISNDISDFHRSTTVFYDID